MSLRLKFLGTGTSVGIPQIGCRCPACTSRDPRDRRRRSGVYVRAGSAAFVIDTPPEFRIACIECGVTKVNAVVLTHAHMDHLAGFDDVRRFNTLNGHAVMPCYAAAETIEAVHHIFPYITDKPNPLGLYRPMIQFRPVSGSFTIGSAILTPLPVVHGPRTNGYLIEESGRRLVYMPDCAEIPLATKAKMRDLDVLVLDCLREREHPTHMNLEWALEEIAELRPRKAYLTHMCHDVVHAEFSKKLPRHVRLAYDGLEIRLGNAQKGAQP